MPSTLGVPRRCTTTSLEEMFTKYGEVKEISRGCDPGNPDLSRLWVTYGSFREANGAIEELNGIKIDEVHSLRVDIALSDEERARRKEFKLEEESYLAELAEVIKSHTIGNDKTSISNGYEIYSGSNLNDHF